MLDAGLPGQPRACVHRRRLRPGRVRTQHGDCGGVCARAHFLLTCPPLVGSCGSCWCAFLLQSCVFLHRCFRTASRGVRARAKICHSLAPLCRLLARSRRARRCAKVLSLALALSLACVCAQLVGKREQETSFPFTLTLSGLCLRASSLRARSRENAVAHANPLCPLFSAQSQPYSG